MHQYAYIYDSKSIHSSFQLEAYKISVDEKSWKHLVDYSGCLYPMLTYIQLDIIQRLAYLKIQTPNDHELNTLPHVIITLDIDSDPKLFDITFFPISSKL